VGAISFSTVVNGDSIKGTYSSSGAGSGRIELTKDNSSAIKSSHSLSQEALGRVERFVGEFERF
jgi:hypothetical protein